jgi:hypothetical protein
VTYTLCPEKRRACLKGKKQFPEFYMKTSLVLRENKTKPEPELLFHKNLEQRIC